MPKGENSLAGRYSFVLARNLFMIVYILDSLSIQFLTKPILDSQLIQFMTVLILDR